MSYTGLVFVHHRPFLSKLLAWILLSTKPVIITGFPGLCPQPSFPHTHPSWVISSSPWFQTQSCISDIILQPRPLTCVLVSTSYLTSSSQNLAGSPTSQGRDAAVSCSYALLSCSPLAPPSSPKSTGHHFFASLSHATLQNIFQIHLLLSFSALTLSYQPLAPVPWVKATVYELLLCQQSLSKPQILRFLILGVKANPY